MTLAVCGVLNTHTIVNCYPIHGLLSYVIRVWRILMHLTMDSSITVGYCNLSFIYTAQKLVNSKSIKFLKAARAISIVVFVFGT